MCLFLPESNRLYLRTTLYLKRTAFGKKPLPAGAPCQDRAGRPKFSSTGGAENIYWRPQPLPHPVLYEGPAPTRGRRKPTLKTREGVKGE